MAKKPQNKGRASNRSTNRNTSRRKSSKKNFSLSIELTGVILAFLAILGGVRLGYLGQVLANLIRLLVGETDRFFFLAMLLYGLYLIIRGQRPKLALKHQLAIGITYITTLLLIEAITFNQFFQSQGNLIQETMNRFVVDFQLNQSGQVLGGGLVGAAIYSTTYFLVSQLGTFFIIALMYSLVAAIVFDLKFSDIMAVVRGHGRTITENVGGKIKEVRQEAKQSKEEKQEEATKSESIQPESRSQKNQEKPGHSMINRIKNTLFQDDEEDLTVHDEEEIDLRYQAYAPEEVPVSNPVQTEIVDPVMKPAPKEIIQTKLVIDDEPLDDFSIDAQKEDVDYKLPPVTLLDPIAKTDQTNEKNLIKKNMQILEQTFKSFGVEAKVMQEPQLGPAVTKFEIKPAVGVKVSKIVNLSDDIALALAAKDIRIEAPIPGKPYIGIEVPNSKTSFVSFSDVIQASLHSDKLLDVPLGRDISGNVRLADLTKMPHLLIAGSTGSGKSVCINGIITSILMKTKPHEVKLMMIDPKMVELNVYNGIPHLLTPVVTNPRKAAQALQKVVAEMEKRYELFASMGMRNIDGYNSHLVQYNLESGENNPTLPYILVIVDELADLMMVASNEVEDAIIRLAQMARAAGIHMVLATQRPSVDVITGIIKANVPSRIAFAVSSGTDSRTIIDSSGAEKLLGRGDMLYMPMGENKPIRVQGAYLTDAEVERVVDYVKDQQEVEYVEEMMISDTGNSNKDQPEDELFYEAVEMLREQETISTSYLQRKFRIGYNRAARLIDELEERGYIGPSEGSKPRKVNIQLFEKENENNENENAGHETETERFSSDKEIL